MSHKTAKQVRKVLRATGDDPRQIEVISKPYYIVGSLPTHPGCHFIPHDLKKTCGRAIYRAAKKELRAS